jgi:hypothetical protein
MQRTHGEVKLAVVHLEPWVSDAELVPWPSNTDSMTAAVVIRIWNISEYKYHVQKV